MSYVPGVLCVCFSVAYKVTIKLYLLVSINFDMNIVNAIKSMKTSSKEANMHTYPPTETFAHVWRLLINYTYIKTDLGNMPLKWHGNIHLPSYL